MPVDVLVTGATGFVGRHLLERAASRGLEAATVAGDLRDGDTARRGVAAARPRAVVHLASALRRGGEPWAALADDVRMAGNVIAAVADLAPEASVLVPGSAAQYGLGGEAPLPENAPTRPVGAYGAAKCVLERACTASPLVGAVRVIYTRSFNHVGPSQPPDAPVAAWARQLAEAEACAGGVVRTGNLDVRRDFLDVRDVADAYLDLVASEAVGVVNVCSGVGVLLADVAAALLRLSAVPVSVELDQALVRSPDPATVVGDPALLRRLTGFHPQISLEQSLLDVLDEQRALVPARGDLARSG